jgi:putative ABC transport system permease protein
MVTLGHSARLQIQHDISGLGQNLLTILPGDLQRGPLGANADPFERSDVRAIRRELAAVGEVAPVANKVARAVSGSRNVSTTVYGVTNEFFSVRLRRVALGRTFTETELAGATPACIVGETVRRQLFGDRPPLTARLRVERMTCRIVGVLKAKGQSPLGGMDQDDMILTTLQTYHRLLAGNYDIGAIELAVHDERLLSSVRARLRSLLRERRHVARNGEDDFTVEDAREIRTTAENIIHVFTMFLGGVAAISLVVGGIGVMNVMLVSVTERTREIGTRLALGAYPEDVLRQFLAEAMLLCLAGGAIGVVLGLSSSYAIARFTTLPFVVESWVVVGAAAFSVAFGAVFGYLPARRAALLEPIEALRYE